MTVATKSGGSSLPRREFRVGFRDMSVNLGGQKIKVGVWYPAAEDAKARRFSGYAYSGLCA